MIGHEVVTQDFLAPGLELALDDFEAFFRIDDVEGEGGSREFTLVGTVTTEFE